MPKRDNELLIDDIVESLNNILEFTKDLNYDDFIDNKMLKYAVVKNLEIIGEASNILSGEFKSDNTQVNWRGMTDLRNRLTHEYFGINYLIVWNLIQTEIQEHLDFIETIKFN